MKFSVIWLRSLASGKEFPVAQFSGDTDMITAGLISLTSLERPELVLAWFTPEEWRLQAPQGALAAERRVNAELGRADLRANWLVRVSKAATPEASRFEEFRKSYLPPTTIHRDIYSQDGEAELVREESAAEFIASGGAVLEQERPDKPLQPAAFVRG